MSIQSNPDPDRQTIEAFYTKNFTGSANRQWSSRCPNVDEATRAGVILPMASGVVASHWNEASDKEKPFRIIDVGCGRGWLTYLLSGYGTVVGLEPVPQVIEYARQLFPGIEFIADTPRKFIAKGGVSGTFDMAVCSEVIEHVPRDQQQSFIDDLAELIGPTGQIILTTPRGELQDIWFSRNPDARQPIENWLTESKLNSVAAAAKLEIVERNRCHPMRLRTTNRLLHRRPFRKLLAKFDYLSAADPIYQVVRMQKRK